MNTIGKIIGQICFGGLCFYAGCFFMSMANIVEERDNPGYMASVVDKIDWTEEA